MHTSYCTSWAGGSWNTGYGDANAESSYSTPYGGDYCTVATNPSKNCCCGDDTGENVEYWRVYPGNPGEPSGKLGGDNTADKACCDSNNDCVKGATCYAEGYHDLDADGLNDYYCYTNGLGWWINVDYHTSYCTANGYHWNVGGDANAESAYYTTTGSRPNYCYYTTGTQPSINCCCGDDTGENYREVVDYAGTGHGTIAWAGGGQDGCCDASNDQINFNGNCVTAGTGGNAVDTGATGNDKYMYPYTAGWLDLDGHSHWPAAFGANVCTGGWIYMYGDSTGEKCGTCGGSACDEVGYENYGCCGDDTGENYRTFLEYAGNAHGIMDWGSSATQIACCDNATDAVDYNSNCVTANQGFAVATGYSGHDQYAYPFWASYGESWLDCDGHSSWPAACGATVCPGGWFDMSGGDSTGEKCGTCGGDACDEVGYENYGCCGDDSGEYYVLETGGTDAPSGYNDAVKTCCNASTDCNYNLACITTLQTSSPAIPNKAYCSAGTWYGGDYTSAACTAIGGTWLTNGTGGTSKCCGDDSGEDFEQTAAGACCYNGAVLANGAASGSVLCSAGQLYDCNSQATIDGGVDTEVTTCDTRSSLYCTASNTRAAGTGADTNCGDLTCQKCNGSGTCVNQNVGQDLFGQCTEAYNACSNQYTRSGGSGNCAAGGVCSTNYELAVTAGYVCQSGNNVHPSAATTGCGAAGAQSCYCDNNYYQCDVINDCTYDSYYVGFAGTAACSAADQQAGTENVNNPSGYRCKAAGTTAVALYTSIMDQNACDDTDNCAGNTRYTGHVCDAGACATAGGGADIGCCQHSKCTTAQYCSAAYACTAYDKCGERTGTDMGEDPQETNEDAREECSESYTACDNQYTLRGGDGYCDGTLYACDTDDATTPVTVGYVCQSGVNIPPTGATTNCGTGAEACYCSNTYYQCDVINDCTYDRFYVGFNAAATCSAAAQVLRDSDLANPSGYRCKAADTTSYAAYASIMDQNACNETAFCSDTSACTHYDCNASGVCNVPDGCTDCAASCQECSATACVSVISGGTVTTCDAGNPCFYIKDIAAVVKARFDKTGGVDVKGTYTSGGTLTPPAGSFILKKAGTVVFYVDSDGNLSTKGAYNAQCSITPAPTGNDDFIIKDAAGIVQGYIDGATGNMYFKKILHYGSSF